MLTRSFETMQIRRYFHRAALVALSLSLLGQPILSHLHTLAETGVPTSSCSAHSTPDALATNRAASPAADAHHDAAGCPLCLARAHSRARALAPAIAPAALVVLAAPPLPTIAVPPARPALRAPSLRGPPTTV